MSTPQNHLAFHAAIILFWGLGLGIPYAKAIKRNAPQNIVHSWRVAHASLPMGAVLMFSVAALMPTFPVNQYWLGALAAMLIVSSYGFAISTPLAALCGQRGLGADEQGCGRWVYVGNMVGVAGSVGAGILLLACTFLAL